jgi:hypothetical protein
VVNSKKDRSYKRHKDLSLLFPAICLQSTGEEIQMNFTGGFMFDLKAFQMQKLHAEYFTEVSQLPSISAID